MRNSTTANYTPPPGIMGESCHSQEIQLLMPFISHSPSSSKSSSSPSSSSVTLNS